MDDEGLEMDDGEEEEEEEESQSSKKLSISSEEKSKVTSTIKNDKTVVKEVVVEDVDNDDDEELLSNVFLSLAGTKTYVSAKDLMNWDMVLELFGEVRTRVLVCLSIDCYTVPSVRIVCLSVCVSVCLFV